LKFMKNDKSYIDFIQSIKKQIVQSRYVAARLANREQLMLYFQTGLMISEKIKAQKWGAKVLDQIADLVGSNKFGKGRQLVRGVEFYARQYSDISFW